MRGGERVSEPWEISFPSGQCWVLPRLLSDLAADWPRRPQPAWPPILGRGSWGHGFQHLPTLSPQTPPDSDAPSPLGDVEGHDSEDLVSGFPCPRPAPPRGTGFLLDAPEGILVGAAKNTPVPSSLQVECFSVSPLRAAKPLLWTGRRLPYFH